MTQNLSPSELREQLAAKEGDRRWHEASDRLKMANEYAHGGLKGLFLANGGAIVALLTFIGNAKLQQADAAALQCSFTLFSLGLGLVLAAYIAGYVSHAYSMQAALNQAAQEDGIAHRTGESFDSSTPDNKAGRAECFGIVLAALALALFVSGAFVALGAIT